MEGVAVTGVHSLDARGHPVEQSPDRLDEALARLEDAGSIQYARRTAQELVESGKHHLQTLPDNEAHALLADIADYLIEREY